MTYQDLRALWSARSLRERRMLAGLAGFLVLLIAWYGVVVPALAWRDAADERLQAAVARSGRTHAGLARLKAAAAAAPATSNLTVDEAAKHAAEAAGLDVRITVTGAGEATFTIASTPTAALFAWLGLLESDYGIRPARLTIAKTPGGLQVEGALPAGAG